MSRRNQGRLKRGAEGQRGRALRFSGLKLKRELTMGFWWVGGLVGWCSLSPFPGVSDEHPVIDCPDPDILANDRGRGCSNAIRHSVLAVSVAVAKPDLFFFLIPRGSLFIPLSPRMRRNIPTSLLMIEIMESSVLPIYKVGWLPYNLALPSPHRLAFPGSCFCSQNPQYLQ